MIEKLINCAKKDKEILAVIVFGSFARGEKFRDIDVCLVLKDTLEPIKISRKKVRISG
jgi:predicted nucleotidyltransferase